MILSRIFVQYKIDFEESELSIEFEDDNKKRKISEIELKLLSPQTEYEDVLKLQEAKRSLLFN